MQAIDEALQRWVRAGVLDEAAAERIRVYEAAGEHPSGLRWQVLLALIFGAILLASGISLFVAAHWDELSPGSRFGVVMATLIVLHVAGLLVRPRFDRLAIALHGIGTVAAGGAVALIGQIFNIQEHWPAGILLWALCALTGWALLRDQLQQTLALLLIPAWILCEWSVRTDGYQGSQLWLSRILIAFAAVYLTGFLGEKKKLVFGLLFAASSVVLVIGTAMLTDPTTNWWRWPKEPPMPFGVLIFGWVLFVVLPLIAAWRFNRPSMMPVGVAVLMALVVPHLYKSDRSWYAPYSSSRSTLAAYGCVAMVSAFLAWWGVQQRSRAVTNYGVVCFAITVMWFYFSSVMDKLERSFSLMMLGTLFLGGGWLLEKMRRKLMRHIEEAA